MPEWARCLSTPRSRRDGASLKAGPAGDPAFPRPVGEVLVDAEVKERIGSADDPILFGILLRPTRRLRLWLGCHQFTKTALRPLADVDRCPNQILAVVLRVALRGSDDGLRLRECTSTHAGRLGNLIAGFCRRPS